MFGAMSNLTIQGSNYPVNYCLHENIQGASACFTIFTCLMTIWFFDLRHPARLISVNVAKTIIRWKITFIVISKTFDVCHYFSRLDSVLIINATFLLSPAWGPDMS